MERRTFHGKLDASALVQALVMKFSNNEFRTQQFERDGQFILQIASRQAEFGDATTALTVSVGQAPDGIIVSIGEQKWLNIAADLVQTGVFALLNPWSLLGEIDDIARNANLLNLPAEIWKFVEQYCESVGATKRMESLVVICPYCGVPTEPGKEKCSMCGGPLTEALPFSCPYCGEVITNKEARFCTNCGRKLAKVG